MSGTVEFLGEQFRTGDRVGLMPMMRYARVTKRVMERRKNGGTSSGEDELESLDATLSLLERCVHPDEWDRFEQHATDQGADLEQFMEFAGKVMAALSDRPTGRSSDSSDGPRTIEPSSTGDSSSAVIHRLNDKGRPDLALMVRKRAESLTG